jgi:mono/diheme cytochrome c family protein
MRDLGKRSLRWVKKRQAISTNTRADLDRRQSGRVVPRVLLAARLPRTHRNQTRVVAMRRVIFSLAFAAFSGTSAFAAEDVGDPQAGFEYAQSVCSGCHGISAEDSPLPKATRFREVADRPGMTGTALRVWMETYHPTMPNIVVDQNDMLNVIAYILSLKGRDADGR